MIRVPAKGENAEFLDDLVLSKNEKIEWMELNRDYLTELKKIITRIGYDEKIEENFTIVESICMAIHDILIDMYHEANTKVTMEEFMKKNKINMHKLSERFKKIIEDKYEELEYDIIEQVLEGSFNAVPIAVIVDDVFLKNAMGLIRILSYNKSFRMGIRKMQKKDDEYSEYDIRTIGQVLLLLDNKIKLDVKQRFKGLGEIEADLMFKVVVNPLYRKIIQLTMTDREKTLDTVYLLHSKKFPDKRRDLLDNTVITYDDIDN